MTVRVDRRPLDADALRVALTVPAGPWTALDVVESTESTNADLLAAARAGAPERSVLVAELQSAGRGRLDRHWISPRGAGLTLSVLFRPAGVPVDRLGWLPLLAGVAVLRAVRRLTPAPGTPAPSTPAPGTPAPGTPAPGTPAPGTPALAAPVLAAPAVLKWPNDLLIGPEQAKFGGILVELAPASTGGGDGLAAVVGIGLNVSNRADELPSGATSLAIAHARELRRDELAVAVLTQLAADEAAWRAAAGDPVSVGLAASYRDSCATLGRPVRVELPGAPDLVGTALDVDQSGRLVVRDELGGLRNVAAGDVVHLRSLR